MASGYTTYMTYMFVSDTGTTNGYGYSDAIHCNYINKITLDNLINKEFNIYFESESEFKFLSTSGGTGYTAHRIIVLSQLIDNELYDNVNDIIPNPAEWRMFDVTDQIIGYVTGQTLSASDVTSNVFRIPISLYNLAPKYNLEYLDYPTKLTGETTGIQPLCFGDEVYFLGNVTTNIEAIAYTTDLAIQLPLDQFNSTNNETWDNVSQVFISEVAIYDVNKNLVGIAKVNNPIPKDSTISRTIVFGLDF
jgi:hypothetical protein